MTLDPPDAPARSGWWGRRSLRTRLTAAAVVVLAAAVAGGSLLLVGRLRSGLIAALDAAIAQRAQDVAAIIARGLLVNPLPGAGSSDVVVQVVDPGGHVAASTSNISGEPLLFAGAPAARPRTVTVPELDPGSYRLVSVRIGSRFIDVAAPTGGITAGVSALRKDLAVGGPAVVVILGTIGWVLIGRALSPVEALRREASLLTAEGLDRRLAVPPTGDELARLAGTLNDLLARLHTSNTRQRQFVADAGHELRSPLTGLRANLEIAARHPEQTDWTAVSGEMLDDVGRLSVLVEDLVRLARLDAAPTVEHRPVRLDLLLSREVDRAARHTPIQLGCAVTPTVVDGDDAALQRVITNLLDNAIRHAASRVDVSLRVNDETAELTVSDDGTGIPPEGRALIFERFTRLDPGRSRDQGGVGLGLAIVRQIVTTHRGTVGVEGDPPGARFVVRLPAGAA